MKTTECLTAMLYRLNRPRFVAAGWTLQTVLTLPVLAMRTVLFPPDPPAWAVDAPPLPLLPAQRAVQDREDQASAEPATRSAPSDLDWSAFQLPPRTRQTKLPRAHRTQRVGHRPLERRNGALFEPLVHHAYGPRRHYAPRPGQEA